MKIASAINIRSLLVLENNVIFPKYAEGSATSGDACMQVYDLCTCAHVHAKAIYQTAVVDGRTSSIEWTN